MTDFFPASDDLSQMLTAAPRQGLSQDAQLARIRATAPAQYTVGPCSRCQGRGTFGSYGTCFKCLGSGKQRQRVYKTSPEARMQNREKAAQRKAVQGERNWAEFTEQYPAEAAWIEAKRFDMKFDFPAKMYGAVQQYGALTENQLAAVRKLVARDAERVAQKASQAVQGARQEASAGLPNLRAAFDGVVARGAKKAQVTVGSVNVSLASMSGRNPGALYVKWNGEYAGKVVGTTFHPAYAFASHPELQAALALIEANPVEAIKAQAATAAQLIAEAIARGEEPEVPCGCCGILLTDPVSRARGIGPICAEKWGF